jgi:CBS domain-containing protein
MKKLIIVPGGFHPWHGGHTALYNAALQAFPSADVFVASTNDTSDRPFPFVTKKLLATAAGVPAERFIQVSSPFRAQEITQMYDPSNTQLIFVRSKKDQDEPPQPGGIKKNGDPAYLQPYKRNGRSSMSQHGYIAYLPVAQFGGGLTSATEIRNKWPRISDQKKVDLVKELYPTVENNDRAAGKLVEILNSVMPVQKITEIDNRLSSFFNDESHTAKIRMIWPGLSLERKIQLMQHLYSRNRPLDSLRAQHMINHIDALLGTAHPVEENLITPMVMPVAESQINRQDYLDEV